MEIDDILPRDDLAGTKFGAEIRKEFMLREGSVFVNHGSYGSIPRCVHNRKVRYLEEMESHPDIWYRYLLRDYLPRAVQKVASFMGVSPDDTFLLQNVTKAVNTVLKSFPLQPGDAILITNLTYGAVKSITRHVTSGVQGCAAHMMNITFPINSEEDIVQHYEAFLSTHLHIKIAIIDHITSPSAIVMPVKRLVEVCHKHDVIVLVDGAHAPGQLSFDMEDVDADFYTGNLHKWVYAPRGCAFLWMNPRRKHSWLKPLITSSCHGEGLTLEFAYEGTKDDTSLLCAVSAIDFYNRLGGIETITHYTSRLREKAVKYLENMWGTNRLPIPDDMVAPNLQMVQLPYIPKYSHNTANYEALQKHIVNKYDIQTYIHHVNDQLYVRVSAQVYNTLDDYKRLAEAILEMTQEE